MDSISTDIHGHAVTLSETRAECVALRLTLIIHLIYLFIIIHQSICLLTTKFQSKLSIPVNPSVWCNFTNLRHRPLYRKHLRSTLFIETLGPTWWALIPAGGGGPPGPSWAYLAQNCAPSCTMITPHHEKVTYMDFFHQPWSIMNPWT